MVEKLIGNSLLVGEIALVTGASRGIGLAIGGELASRGAYVVGTATNEAGAGALEEVLNRSGEGRGEIVRIEEPSSVDTLYHRLNELDKLPSILVNNAGIKRDNLLARMKNEEWADVIDINLNGMFRLTRGVIRTMMRKRHGRIINITSVVAEAGNTGQANYAAAKAGIIGFTRSLAKEVASRGITVNAIAPGFISTDMTDSLDETQQQKLLEAIPVGRFGKPDEVAKAVAFLASRDAAYITGITLPINGGMYMG